MNFNTDINPKHLSPLTLAFIGDAVFELLVRQYLVVSEGSMPVGSLHKKTVTFVKASSQSKSMENLLDILDEEEEAIFRRGRNANGTHVPKNANPIDYRRATGLEAVFGYLYLKGSVERVNELFAVIWDKALCEGSM